MESYSGSAGEEPTLGEAEQLSHSCELVVTHSDNFTTDTCAGSLAVI